MHTSWLHPVGAGQRLLPHLHPWLSRPAPRAPQPVHKLPHPLVPTHASAPGDQPDDAAGPMPTATPDMQHLVLAIPDRVHWLRATVEVPRHGRTNLEHVW